MIGRLAVQGRTGCRYLSDPRQADYVKGGWNYTGDAYPQDTDGYFFYQSRTDDMIISPATTSPPWKWRRAAAPRGGGRMRRHRPPDEERGQIVKAFIVLRAPHAGDAAMVKALQDFVKATVAPYKYPRAVEFREALPRTKRGSCRGFRSGCDCFWAKATGAICRF